MKIICYLILFLMFSTVAGCVTERERRGVSHIPFNAPPDDNRRTFNGDF